MTRRRFTIIEVLAVLAIVMAILAFLLPALAGSKAKARYTRWLGFVNQLQTREDLFAYYDFSAEGGDQLLNRVANSSLPGYEERDYDAGVVGATWSVGGGRWPQKDALAFDGRNDYVWLPWGYGTGDLPRISICAWLRSTSSKRQVLVSFDRSEVFRFALSDPSSRGQLGFDTSTATRRMRDDFGAGKPEDLGLLDGNWHLVCAVYDQDANPTKKLYVDGELVGSAHQHPGEPLGRSLRRRPKSYGFIGTGSEAGEPNGRQGPTNRFDGEIDELMIFHSALSESFINDMYRMGTPSQ